MPPSEAVHALAPILQDLVKMTGLRNHARLEISVMATLCRLAHVDQVQLMDLVQDQGKNYVEQKYVQRGGVLTLNEEATSHESMEPLSTFEILAKAVENHQPYAIDPADHAPYRIWLILWRHQEAKQCIELHQPMPFDSVRVELLCSIFQVYQNYQDLLDYSERDALTGLYNRKTFDELRYKPTSAIPQSPQAQFSQEKRRSEGTESALTQQQEPLLDWLAIIDIDDFKQINDRFGHLYGDEVLILVSNVLKESFRRTDRVFRYGGEEFVVLLRAATRSTVQAVLDRFRVAVADYPFPQVGQVTVSIGFVQTDQAMLANLIGYADKALYYVKQNGKNQAFNYHDLLQQGLVQSPIQHQEVDLF